MITPTAFLSPSPIIGNVGPTVESGASARHPASARHKGSTPVPHQTALVPRQPPDSRLTRFLSRPSIELMLSQDLEPQIGLSNLRNPATFDDVLRRSRDAMRAAVTRDGAGASLFQAALQALDRHAVLWSHSRCVRNTLFQG